MLDLNMPIMDGKEAFTIIRDHILEPKFRGKHCPAIFILTADETDSTRDQLNQIGCVNVISQLRLSIEVPLILTEIQRQLPKV